MQSSLLLFCCSNSNQNKDHFKDRLLGIKIQGKIALIVATLEVEEFQIVDCNLLLQGA